MTEYPDHIAKLAQAACADKRTRQGGYGAIADALMILDKRNAALIEALERCVKTFNQCADAGNYPLPLMENGGWRFALDAIKLAKAP